MSSDKDKSKDPAFSFEKTPAKTGGEAETGNPGHDNDFNFSDIPVLGNIDSKKDKDKKVSFSFDSGRSAKPPEKELGLSSYEAILRDQMKHPHPQDQEQNQYPDIPKTEPQQQETDASQSKWEKIASCRKHGFKLTRSVKILIVSATAVAIVVSAGVLSFSLLKSKQQGAAVKTAPAGKTAKPDPVAEEKARRLANLEKKLADADTARRESKFNDALKAYRSLMSEDWKEKEPVVLFGAAECHENMAQDDEAVSYYAKCIDAGWKDNAQPYVRLSKLLNKKNKYSDSVKYLEKARGAFPADTYIGAQLANSYCLAGQTDKAAAELKKANKSDMSLDMIKLFGSVLQKDNDKSQARELYVYGMKKFRDMDCFMSAASLSDKPQDKVDIMTQAVGVVDENMKSTAIMRLTELLMQTGKKDEAAKQLDKISLDQLKPESATDFLKMLLNCNNLLKFAPEYKKAMELYPKDFVMHLNIYETLIENGQEILALDTYREWWTAKEEPVSGYLYAKSIGVFSYRSLDAVNEEAIPAYEKVTELNPRFFEAFLELGYLYTMERNWAGAEHAYSECVRIKPDDRNARRLLALARESAGKGEEAVDEYERYLVTLNLPPEEKAAELIDIAQKLEKPERAGKCLEELGKSPKYADEHRVQTMKFKLTYGKPNDNDFADPYPKAGRKFHEYYLLSKGRSNEVLLMTVPPDEFPDFWKLFLLWKGDKPGWQDGMNALVAKNKAAKDATYRIIADMWNGKRSPDEARKLLSKVHPDNEPLFFLMLAEKYRKDKVESKAKVCYQKAASERRNPLVRMIDSYSQIPMR
ncbi:MAG: tetratricopeptide repeat protein [Victivallales bacterium]